MDKGEEGFQKRLTLYSVLAAAFFAVVTVLITLGFTWSQFNFTPPVDNSQINNPDAEAIQAFVSAIQARGNNLVQYSIILLIIAIPLFSIVILKDTSKSKSKHSKSSQIDSLNEIDGRKDLGLEKPDGNTRILDEDMNKKSIELEKNQLQGLLQNARSQLQVTEIKLQISELKTQLANVKLNKIQSKRMTPRGKPRGKRSDSKRTKKSL